MSKIQNSIVLLLISVYFLLGSSFVGSIDVNGQTFPEPPITEINKNDTTSTVTPPANISTTEKPTSTIPPNPNSTTVTTPVTPTNATTVTPKPAPITNATTVPPQPTPTPNTTTTVKPPDSTTTGKPSNVTTVKPTAAPPTTPVPSHRRFDGPSFIGGIVLALGLVAIGFVAFKFYKARTELNYHTL